LAHREVRMTDPTIKRIRDQKAMERREQLRREE
jgi:hypothetical protein